MLASIILIFVCHFHLEYYPCKLGVNEKNIGNIVSSLNSLNYEEDETLKKAFKDNVYFNGEWNGECTYIKGRAGISINRYKTNDPDKDSFGDEAKAYIKNNYITSLFQDIYPKLIKTKSFDNVECVFSPLHTDRYEDDIISFIGAYEETVYIFTGEYIYGLDYNCPSFPCTYWPNVYSLNDILSQGEYYADNNA